MIAPEVDRSNHCIWFQQDEHRFKCRCDKFFNAGARCYFENDGLQAREICKYYRVSNIKQVNSYTDAYKFTINNKVISAVFTKEELISLKELIENWLKEQK